MNDSDKQHAPRNRTLTLSAPDGASSSRRLLRAPLLADVRGLILAAREQVARAVDSGLVTLYWHIGRRIRQDILKEKRAEYGAQIVSALGRQLEAGFGRGFSEKSLRHMLRFAEVSRRSSFLKCQLLCYPPCRERRNSSTGRPLCC